MVLATEGGECQPLDSVRTSVRPALTSVRERDSDRSGLCAFAFQNVENSPPQDRQLLVAPHTHTYIVAEATNALSHADRAPRSSGVLALNYTSRDAQR